MTEEQRNFLDSLFEAALGLPPHERHAYLSSRCDDPVLLHEVESLLEYSQDKGGINRPQAAAANAALVLDVPPEDSIGPYRILCAVGAGGMGTVYKAVREDEFRMTVAIKLLHFDARAEAEQRRFRQERQILAELAHPHIARLIDGGATPQGVPYIVMEYVEGLPLTDYCQQQRLTLAEKLRLFRKICDAVQYAHQKLIVHRDIKPGNILVTAEGVPKLLDFGIAKLLAPDPASGMAETATALQRMTPDYASPEQVRGEAVSVATDVYALGAVLFELLTGDRAHRLKNYDMAEIVREVCLTQVRRPSLAGIVELRGDLDTIVLKAMQKEPARRYQSVDQLSEDLLRHLEGFPVRARPDTMRYRARKFARRNRFVLAAMAAIAVTLVGGIVASQYQAQRAEQEFQHARRLARTALFDVSKELGNLPGARRLRDIVVRTSLEYLDTLTPRARRDPGLRYEIAEGYMQIGELQHSHDLSHAGDAKGAIRSWRHALDLIRQDADGRDARPEATKLMADILLAIGEAESSLQHAEQARQAMHQAETPAKALIAMHPKGVQSYGSLFSVYNLEGDNELYAGDPLRALDRYLLAWKIREEAIPKSSEDYLALGQSAGIRLGDAYHALGRLWDALAWYQRALDCIQALLTKSPQDYTNQLYEGVIQSLLGELYFGPALSLHDLPRALEQFRPAYRSMERLQRADPNDAQVRDFFILLSARYVYVLRQTQANEALAIARRTAGIAAAIPRGTGSIDDEIDRTAASLTMARALAAAGDHGAALALFAEAVRTYNDARASAPDRADLAAQGILSLLEWGDLETKRDPRGGQDHLAEAFRLAAAYQQAHPGQAYIAALSEQARQRLARGAPQPVRELP